MNLGNFSLSIAVKDISSSLAFYEKLGFSKFGGDQAQGWLILKNENVILGLFQGMFEDNLLTFNPGWDSDAREVEGYTDVRELQRQLKDNGITPMVEVDEEGSGPGSFMIKDPDGNVIMFDQHV
jgi:predicted lactoylglutathione lyase